MDKDTLLKNAKQVIKLAWHRKSKKPRELGFLLQHHFGKGVWLLKDLDEKQLEELTEIGLKKLSSSPK